MRLPFPERVSLPLVLVGATVLVCLQALQNTDPYFSVFSFLFIVIAAIAFNLAGGFTQTTGAYVFFYAVLGAILGIVYKAYLGEPADSNLRSPILTMQVFTGGITSMLFAVIVSRKLRRKRPFLQTLLREKDMRNAAIGCLVVGLVLALLNLSSTHESGSVLSAVSQLNRFLQMSVVVATLAAIRKTNGRSATSGLVLLCISVCFAYGVISFSKEGIFTPLVCWALTACSQRVVIRPYQLIVCAVIVYVCFHFLVPYSQYGRDQIYEETSLIGRAQISVDLIANLDTTREQYLAQLTSNVERDEMGYFNESQGFFDRLSMMAPDDALINFTRQGNFSGLAVIPASFLNWIPHFLWPGKPTVLLGNTYAQKIGGIVGDDDNTTGISFSPSGEAYQLAGWVGIFLVAPAIWIMLFTLFDSLCGDVRQSPWGIIIVALYSHAAPEGMLTGMIYIMWYAMLAIVLVAVTTAYVMPIIGTLIAGPENTIIISTRRMSSPRTANHSTSR